MSPNDETVDSNELILSAHPGSVANVSHQAELATVRQMMETLLARMEVLQQNHAVQLAGVHDRLDAVELELPLIQEQGALRMRDMETRLSVEIDQAARSAVEEATAAASAVAQEEVAGKFSSLAAQMEAQRIELRQIRESKMLADVRLNRAILDIERLCGNLTPSPEQEPIRTTLESVASPFHSRISEHIRKAALDMAPGNNPLNGDGHPRKLNCETATPAPAAGTVEKAAPAQPVVAEAAPPANAVPGFDAWKRQFMQDAEPFVPERAVETGKGDEVVICPRCYSDRTRPATLNRWDPILRVAHFVPHRCRSCSHRFYRRGVQHAALHDEESAAPAANAMETR